QYRQKHGLACRRHQSVKMGPRALDEVELRGGAGAQLHQLESQAIVARARVPRDEPMLPEDVEQPQDGALGKPQPPCQLSESQSRSLVGEHFQDGKRAVDHLDLVSAPGLHRGIEFQIVKEAVYVKPVDSKTLIDTYLSVALTKGFNLTRLSEQTGVM